MTDDFQVVHGAGRPPLTPFLLQKRHPLLYGLWAFALRLHAQQVGVMFVNTTASVVAATHLYNAVLRSSTLSRRWDDIEMIWTLHTPQSLFVGDPPNLENCHTRFRLSMGESITFHARDKGRRTPSSKKSPKGAKGLSELAQLSRLCAERYCNNSKSVSWTRDSIGPVMDSVIVSERPEGAITNEDGSFAVELDAREDVTRGRRGIRLYKPRHSQPDSNNPFADFYGNLFNILEVETKEMSFDYFLMHRICWKLLRRVNEFCRPQLTELFRAGYLPKEHHLPMLPEYIFQTISAHYHPVDDEGEVPLLVSAAKAFEELFRDEPDAVLKRSPEIGLALGLVMPK